MISCSLPRRSSRSRGARQNPPVTPAYLKEIGLLDEASDDPKAVINKQMQDALGISKNEKLIQEIMIKVKW